MPPFIHPLDFSEGTAQRIKGQLELDDPLPFSTRDQGSGFYRPGSIKLEDCPPLGLVLYHTPATARFMYIRQAAVDPNLLAIVGLSEEEIAKVEELHLPGQLCMGAERALVIEEAMSDIFRSPAMHQAISGYHQQNIAAFPIAREGLKYGVTDALFENYGFYCDEIVLDAHHVFDSSVPVYNRKVEMTLFKDKDLDQHQRENISVAFLADSIASGLVMKEVIERVKERFDHIHRVEVISPLSTVRGLCRIARSSWTEDTQVRVHVFDTLLNALPPDYYYSAHFNIPEMHIRPDLEKEYRAWWGKDAKGNAIADTACAGYGWSEVFYSPRKQIQMMNGELGARHNLTIADILRRKINKKR